MKRIWTIGVFALMTACAHADPENHRIVPTDAQLHCDTDDDCTLASLACATCGDVVAKAFAAKLEAEAQSRCTHYTGPVVECAPPRAPDCNAHRCAAGSNRAREKE